MSQHRPTVRAINDDAPPVAWTFFRQWLKNPRGIAAVSPSSRHLASAMVSQVPADAERVVELGGGTGVITEALLKYGIPHDRLMVVEINPDFHAMLQQRFPGTLVTRGDARELVQLIEREHFAQRGGVDAVVSGLGLLSMSKSTQRQILTAVFDALTPSGSFIQFTYGPLSPISRELLDELGLRVRRASMSWRNMPPATVFVFTRNRSTAVHPVRAAVQR